MPKVVNSAKDREHEFKSQGLYSKDRKILMCKYCNCTVTWDRRDTILKHIHSEKHKRLAAQGVKVQLQTTIGSSFNTAQIRKHEVDQFALKTTAAFMKANIPLEKLQNPVIRIWMNEFIEGAGSLPCVRTLREKYVPELAKQRVHKVKDILKGQDIVIFADETTDKKGRCVFVVLFRTIEAELEQKMFVGGVHFLERADATHCARAVLDSIKKYDIQYDSIVGFVSDGARYMSKCVETLQIVIGDQLLQVQCWAHKLNLVGNIYVKELVVLNNAVSKLKSAFLNTRKRKHLYMQFLRDKYTDVSKAAKLFPLPVMTRWNSWFYTVYYIAEYYHDLIEFFCTDDMKDIGNAGIAHFNAMNADVHTQIQLEATFVTEHTKDLVGMVECLEGSNYATSHTLYSKLQHLKEELNVASFGTFGEQTRVALQSAKNEIIQADLKQNLQRASSIALEKLTSLMAKDPSRKTFSLLNDVLDPVNAVLKTIDTSTIEQLKRLREMNNVSDSEVACGYIRLKNIFQELLEKKDKVNIVQVLSVMKEDYPNFSTAALKAVWMPCANVDSERSLSAYNTVLSDMRHNLSDTNLETMTIMCFEKDEAFQNKCIK